MRTLKSKLKAFGLRRRSLQFDVGKTRARIQPELDGPYCMAGYKSIWHSLRREYFDVSDLKQLQTFCKKWIQKVVTQGEDAG